MIQSRMYSFLTSIVMILAVCAGFVGAADEAAPGDLLYAVDRRLENMQRQLQRRPNLLYSLNDRIQEERLLEAGQLIEGGAIEGALSLLEENGQTNPGALASTPIFSENQISIGNPEQNSETASDCMATTSVQQPALSNLATSYRVSYSVVLGWYCAGFGVGEIAQAYSISAASKIPVEVLFDQAGEGYAWGDIAQAAGVGSGTAPTETPETLTAYCSATGVPQTDNQHPGAVSVAESLHLPYEAVMRWYCQGFGFGEIRLAYALSDKSGLIVDDIFALRIAGMGWGEIMQQLNLNANTPNNPTDEPPKPKPTEKPKKTEKPPKP